MLTVDAAEARSCFDDLLDRAQHEPVRFTHNDRVVSVLVSADDYDAMRAFYANRLQTTMERAAEEAQRRGLTPEALDALLAEKK